VSCSEANVSATCHRQRHWYTPHSLGATHISYTGWLKKVSCWHSTTAYFFEPPCMTKCYTTNYPSRIWVALSFLPSPCSGFRSSYRSGKRCELPRCIGSENWIWWILAVNCDIYCVLSALTLFLISIHNLTFSTANFVLLAFLLFCSKSTVIGVQSHVIACWSPWLRRCGAVLMQKWLTGFVVCFTSLWLSMTSWLGSLNAAARMSLTWSSLKC